MERPSGVGQQVPWRASFQWIYLSRLGTMLRHGKLERAASVSTRSRTVKFAADLSLATTSRGRTAWRRAIICKYISRINKSRRQLRVANSRGNSQGKKQSVYAKARPCKPNAVRGNSDMRLPGAESGQTVTTGPRSRDAGGAVASRMQILRNLVPGSRGLDTPVFLKEAADYIEALKMQVQALKALADQCYSNSNAHAACYVSI